MWRRIIFYISDLDAMYAWAIAQGLYPEAAPRDAEWGERYFHLLDLRQRAKARHFQIILRYNGYTHSITKERKNG